MKNINKKKTNQVVNSIKKVAIAAALKDSNIPGLIKTIAKVVKQSYKPALKTVNDGIKDLIKLYGLKEADPLMQNFNFILFSDYDYYEPKWTKWLANCLKDQKCGPLFWEALCLAIKDTIDTMKSEKVCLNKESKFAINWGSIATSRPAPKHIKPEADIKGVGRLDIEIDAAPQYYIIIENKIDAPTTDQLKRYKRQAKAKRCKYGLILLSRSERGETEKGWINITYRNLSVNLRKLLYQELRARRHFRYDVLHMVPVLSTINSIEKDLLKYRYDPNVCGELYERQEILKYLKEGCSYG